MEHRKVIHITKEEEKFCDKYLTLEPKCEEECLPEGCHINHTADFNNGYEMDIKLCGVLYEETCSNTAWTEAVLFHNGNEVACTDVCDEYTGEWVLEHNGDTFIVEVKVL